MQKYSKSDTRAAWLMLAPFLLFFVCFIAYPAAANILYSLTNYNLSSMNFIGFKNYIRLTKDRAFITALGNTAVYAAVSVTMLTALGFLSANALNSRLRGVRWLRMLMLYPYATSMTAVSMIWLMMFDPLTGFINKALRFLSLPTETWLFDADLALSCLIFVNIWKNAGYCMLIFMAGLQSVPCELYEAATIDGAGPWRKLRSITLPMLRPITLFVVITTTIESFKTFEQVQIMTRGDPMYATTTIVHQIYQRGFTECKMGYAASMSVVLLCIVLVLTLINFGIDQRLNRGMNR